MFKIKNITIQIIILLVSITSVLLFFIKPTINEIKSSKHSLKQKQTDLINSTEKYEALKKASKNEVSIAQIETKILGLYPDDKDISNFIINLEKLAKNENLTFNNLSISEAKSSGKKAEASSVQFDFNTSGSYQQINNIVKKLEQFARVNTINNLNLSIKGENDINLKVTGHIYYGK